MGGKGRVGVTECRGADVALSGGIGGGEEGGYWGRVEGLLNLDVLVILHQACVHSNRPAIGVLKAGAVGKVRLLLQDGVALIFYKGEDDNLKPVVWGVEFECVVCSEVNGWVKEWNNFHAGYNSGCEVHVRDEVKRIVDERGKDGDKATLQLPCRPHVGRGGSVPEAYK